MKQIIAKITNEKRLIKLYGCERCQSRILMQLEGECPKCNGKGYTINRDSQVLDIVKCLISVRSWFCTNSPEKLYYAYKNLAKALIKLIELSYDEGSLLEEPWLDLKKDYGIGDIERDINHICSAIFKDRLPFSHGFILSFCNHHKINIWDSVTEILEGEG